MQLVDVYNRNAEYWDSSVYRAAYHGAYVRLFRMLQRSGVLRNPVRVLDCGIGAGLFSESLLDVSDSPLEIHGVDRSSSLLAMAMSKFERRGSPARFAFGDVCHLPYRTEAMDVVLSALVLEHVPRPVDAVREMARVLRRGRALVIIATRRGAPDHFFRLKYHYRPYRKTDLLRWIRESGLTEVGSHSLSGIARLFAHAYVGIKA
ncbi:MAG TPA: class I SAM-dependent methyltransferase [Bryobacteraceae bacterium]|nr:class I SAM-dependent methyltransferase [Bryobacteraceae bacterium]